MEQLSTHDIRRMLGFLQALYVLRPQQEFSGYLVAAIPTIISTDASSYNEINSRMGTASYQGWPPDHPDIPDSREILGRYAHQSPLIIHAERSPSATAAKMSDFVSHRTFKTSTLFNEFYRPLRLHFNMGARLTHEPGPLVAVGLLRARRDFTSHDVMLLNVMSPHLIQAYHNAAAITRMQEQVTASSETLEERHQGLISVTEDGSIRFSTPLADQLMLRYDRTAKRNPGCLPP
ncbi:MAG: hypothetical protein Q8N04_08875 [Nitrospira sp.]|nr:hypothetical protein [Nitrospira sp.]